MASTTSWWVITALREERYHEADCWEFLVISKRLRLVEEQPNNSWKVKLSHISLWNIISPAAQGVLDRGKLRTWSPSEIKAVRPGWRLAISEAARASHFKTQASKEGFQDSLSVEEVNQRLEFEVFQQLNLSAKGKAVDSFGNSSSLDYPFSWRLFQSRRESSLFVLTCHVAATVSKILLKPYFDGGLNGPRSLATWALLVALVQSQINGFFQIARA